MRLDGDRNGNGATQGNDATTPAVVSESCARGSARKTCRCVVQRDAARGGGTAERREAIRARVVTLAGTQLARVPTRRPREGAGGRAWAPREGQTASAGILDRRLRRRFGLAAFSSRGT